MTPEEQRDLNNQLHELMEVWSNLTPAQKHRALWYARWLKVRSIVDQAAPWLLLLAVLLWILSALVRWG